GVATTICDPRRMFCNWEDSFIPPTTTEERTGRLAASFTAASWTWSASSRVGVRIRAETPVGRSPRERSSKIGRRNARVLPVPVCAVATTSRPSRAGGIACACTGVGWTNPLRVKLLCSVALRVSSENLFIQCCFWGEIQRTGLRFTEGADLLDNRIARLRVFLNGSLEKVADD